MIIIFARHNDIHALAVQSCLARQLSKEARIVDVADYPTLWSIDFLIGRRNEYTIQGDDWIISSEEVEGVWRRRGLSPAIHESVADPDVRKFCYNESLHLFGGLVSNISNVVNAEGSEVIASRKPRQLQVALDVGLKIPDTLISTSPTKIRDFYDRHSGDIVFKTLTPPQFHFSETRVLMEEHLHLLDSAVFAPTIYQERIVPDSHFRITIIDKSIYCASINTTKDHAIMDWRLDPDPIIKPVELQSDLTEKLLKLMSGLGIRYGAIDMIVDGRGECFFLEVNPGGQFLFVEVQTGQPISLALASALATGP